MNGFKKLLLFLPIAILCFSSCSLDVDQREKETEELFLLADANISKLWVHLYSSFVYTGGLLDCATDDADYNVIGGLQSANEGTWNQYNNELDGNGNQWKQKYALLRDAAYFLRITDTVVTPRLTYSDYYVPSNRGMMIDYMQKRFNLRSYRTDAKFFQAYNTFELWKQYGMIPVVDREYSPEEALSIKQSGTQEVMDFLTRKLDEVIAELDSLQNYKGQDYFTSPYRNNLWEDKYYGRINKGIALALKTRAYLYAASPLNAPNPSSNGYDQAYCDLAAKAAAQLIALGIYDVGSDYRNIQFTYTREDILSKNYSGNVLEVSNYPRIANNILYNNADVSRNAFCPSQNLVDTYSETPVDYNLPDPYANITDRRFYQTVVYNNASFNGGNVEIFSGGLAARGLPNSTTTGYYLKKNVRNGLNLIANQYSLHFDYIFRYGEVLLNYAEASFNGTLSGGSYDGAPTALQAINLLRARKDISGGVAVNTPLARLTNDKIRNERRVELAFEGHRFWDVRRWKLGDTQNDDLMGIDIGKNGDSFTHQRIKVESRIFYERMYHFPIPYIDRRLYPSWNYLGWD